MASKKTAVFGIYSTRGGVEKAAEAIARTGFRVTDISVLIPESLEIKDNGNQKPTNSPEGATEGASSGAVLDRTLNLLAGIGTLRIPGVAPLIAGGPIKATLAEIEVGGAAGDFAEALIGMGVPEYEAKRYEWRLHRRAILLSIHCDSPDEIIRAKEILDRTGGEEISSTGESSNGPANPGQRSHGKASAGNK